MNIKHLDDYRLQPRLEPNELGICAGCGDMILSGEEYAVSEGGDIIHKHVDCLAQYSMKIFGLRQEELSNVNH